MTPEEIKFLAAKANVTNAISRYGQWGKNPHGELELHIISPASNAGNKGEVADNVRTLIENSRTLGAEFAASYKSRAEKESDLLSLDATDLAKLAVSGVHFGQFHDEICEALGADLKRDFRGRV